jgi:hypothetical protein
MSQDALVLEFLVWVAGGERSYGDTMEAWRTHCPRMPVWEDAVRDGLVELMAGGAMRARKVALTQAGRARLGREGALPPPGRTQPPRESGLRPQGRLAEGSRA